jgi:hypothetical protein
MSLTMSSLLISNAIQLLAVTDTKVAMAMGPASLITLSILLILKAGK